MAEVASAYVALIPTFKGGERAIQNEISGAMATGASSPGVTAAGKTAGKGIAGGMKSAMSGVGGQMVGAMGVGALVAGVTGYVSTGVAAAGDLEQSVGAVQTVFKDSSTQMLNWSKDAATAVGLTQNEYNTLATVLGSQLKNGGTPLDEIGGKTNELVTAGADLASMFGGSTADAVGALSSALKGERDPIERYGVSLKQTAIDAKAAELGFEKVGGSLSNEASQAATLALIMEQTTDAHGNFAAESETAAGKQAIFSASMGNLSAAVGTVLIPALTTMLAILTPIALWFADNQWAVVGLAAVLGGALTLGFVAATIAAWAFVAPLLANPITWIVLGIVALIAGLVLLILNWSAVVAWLKSVWSGVVGWLAGVWSRILGGITVAWTRMVTWLKGWGGRVFGAISGGIGSLAGWLGRLWDTIYTGVSGAWGKIITFVVGIPGRIAAGFTGLGKILMASGSAMVNGFLDGIVNAWGRLTGWVSGAMENLRGLWPFSPAKWGPFSGHGYVTYSGAALTGDFAKSIVKGTPQIERASLGVLDAASVPSMAWQGPGQMAANVAASPAPVMPSSITVVDSDGALVGRMRVEAGRVQSGGVTPLSEGRVTW